MLHKRKQHLLNPFYCSCMLALIISFYDSLFAPETGSLLIIALYFVLYYGVEPS